MVLNKQLGKNIRMFLHYRNLSLNCIYLTIFDRGESYNVIWTGFGAIIIGL